jgi:propionyl-CoA synthetase
VSRLDAVVAEWRRSPGDFWLRAASTVAWDRAPSKALDLSRPPFAGWFPDGQLNLCHNLLDRHVDSGRGDRPALVHESPVTGTTRSFTYAELRDDVARFAGVLVAMGVRSGDRVLIYMPMVPEAVVAMLACARIGAVHSVVFGGFAPREVAARIDDAQPRAVVTASSGIEGTRVIPYLPLLDRAFEMASHRPAARILLQRPECSVDLGSGTYLDWHEAMAAASPVGCTPLMATDPLYILYTSGTTGRPTGVLRDIGGYAVALSWSMTNIFDVGPDDVMFTASDIGWVVGHSYIVYGPLLAGACTVLYEGKPVGTPDAGEFWRVVRDHRVTTMFTAPTALRAIRREDPDGALVRRGDITTLRHLFLAGERLDPETHAWACAVLGIPVVDNWWQTETGWPVAANPAGLGLLPTKPGSTTRVMPGWDVSIVDDHGDAVPAGREGMVLIRLPLPPGSLPTLWNDDGRFVGSYLTSYPGYYLTGDRGHLDSDGYLFIAGRADDVINVAGHRLSGGGIEQVLSSHRDIAECAVVGVADALKGQVPRGFVVLKAGVQRDPADLSAELVALVREEIGAVASLRRIDVVPALPKTRSGKILRNLMRAIVDGLPEPPTATIEDPSVLEQLRPILTRPATASGCPPPGLVVRSSAPG